jgi:hypothetical protein
MQGSKRMDLDRLLHLEPTHQASSSTFSKARSNLYSRSSLRFEIPPGWREGDKHGHQ